MGLRQFNADVAAAAAAEQGLPHVTHVRRGDSEGEVVFTYAHGELGLPLEIQALAQDVGSYPHDAVFIVFTSSENVDKAIISFLDGLSEYTREKSVHGVIGAITDRLTAKLEARYTPELDHDSQFDSASEAPDSSDFDDEAYGDIDESFGMDIDLRPRKEPSPVLPPPSDPTAQHRLKRDLTAASRAGLSVGVLGSNNHAEGIFSLAIRVSKLGIQEDTLEAWGLKPPEYIVLLFRFPMGYPRASLFFQLPSDQTNVRFRFGKCSVAKPSLESARLAFASASPQGHGAEEDNNSDGTNASDVTPNAFSHMYMFSSINSLLNEELARLLSTRRERNLSWDEAQEYRFQIATGEYEERYQGGPVASCAPQPKDDGPLITPSAPQPLRHDYAMEQEEDFNLPLVAMQYALRRFARCTLYCTICHTKMQHSFESVKPYVCSKPLCLYQYISLGFGPSIEHEIINNPYVVDLLISFFFAASANNRHRESSRGLNLKTAITGPASNPAEHILAQAQFNSKFLHFDLKDYSTYRSIKQGHLVALVAAHRNSTSSGAVNTHNAEQHVCRITTTGADHYTFEIISSEVMLPGNVMIQPEDSAALHSTNPTDDWVSVKVFQFNQDVDELDDKDRDAALMLLANLIPSVQEMRAYLLERSGRRLASWHRMDTPIYTLLNWIVASNRSYIVQDGPIPKTPPVTTSGQGEDVPNTSSDAPLDQPDGKGNKVTGMPDDWMQFRFVQGSPEKEQQFVRELETASKVDDRRERYPTLFVWHGSPLGNWHSIIRTGLDFATQLHGRSNGHGVYFSSNLAVSSGYLGPGHGGLMTHNMSNDIRVPHWQNSQLRISAAISVCEVINRPEDFVSTLPHWVINKVEWIQCRYLLVRVSATDTAQEEPFSRPSAHSGVGYWQQDPERRLRGLKSEEVEVPLSTRMAARKAVFAMTSDPGDGMATSTAAVAGQPSSPEDANSEDDDDDLDWMLHSDDAADGSNKSGKRRRRSSDDSMVDGTVAAKLDTASHDRKSAGEGPRLATPVDQAMMDEPKSSFRPGTLDPKTLPQLPLPSWASSSSGALRRLNQDVKEMQKIQSEGGTKSAGWYIDFNSMTNLFHWIVELHSFDDALPLARDMRDHGCASIVLELRFGPEYPMSPPFVRVIRPRFLPFTAGGGGHVTGGGAICSELLTNSGWLPSLSLEKVLLEVRMNLCDMDPPARLQDSAKGSSSLAEYGIGEAVAAYQRSSAAHGWKIPDDLAITAANSWV